MQRLSITYKLTALLALLSTAPLVFLVFNRTSQEISSTTRARYMACEQLALGCSLELKHQDRRGVEQLLDHFMQRSNGLEGVRVVRFGGLVRHQLGHSTVFAVEAGRLNTAAHIRLPILRAGEQ